MVNKSRKLKILLVSSSGGHLYKTYLLKDWWKNHNRLWIAPNNRMTQSLLRNENTVFSSAPDQRLNWINLIKNSFLAIKIMNKKKPDIIFSTGSGTALPFFFLAKLTNTETIFMETFIFINQPTLTGKIIYKLNLADKFLIQNKNMRKYYPNAKFWGSII